ncbi:Uncharacterized membrane protein YgdD, TMEM256/DUF423 family [Cnuella takakiae]|uniref:Uncharacterized membrane protein YgdD, TMEM256/DUF423 family n=1 Tax=Cnuella takakiae TaxID=1302690 RepID=A0A1M5HH32_9BACT|nr:DUF423 domain-containing protein [Cnuella takakiae]OLY92869.1 hypothetical protein BUE76_13965 [Cnuella takakiae]SHG15266.1 Uncharacterized membrane protein YgdD, TMEM256/DUF423 family [Cnuella takakiae]
MNGKLMMVLGSLLAGLGVVLGAFGAHGLKKLVAPETVGTFQTGVQYQMYHAFALLVAGLLWERLAATSSLSWAGWSFIIGILLFSGSLYALVMLKATNKVGLGGIGIITPIGGLFFIAGWVFLALALMKRA